MNCVIPGASYRFVIPGQRERSDAPGPESITTQIN